MSVRHTLKGTIAVLALAGLVGCASTGGSDRPQVTLADPTSVPKENWSDALEMFTNQMGIYGMQDATQDSTHAAAAGLIDNTRHLNGVEMGVLAQSVATGALFFMLDSGPSNPMIRNTQIAFWVPASQAGSAQEAADIVANTWADIRREVVAGRREVKVDAVTISGYPIGHPKAFGSIKEELHNERPPFEGEARMQRIGNQEGMFYGPIFVHRGSAAHTDTAATKLTTRDLVRVYAKHLPETAMIYHPGRPEPKVYDPAVLIYNGKEMTFKAKH